MYIHKYLYVKHKFMLNTTNKRAYLIQLNYKISIFKQIHIYEHLNLIKDYYFK